MSAKTSAPDYKAIADEAVFALEASQQVVSDLASALHTLVNAQVHKTHVSGVVRLCFRQAEDWQCYLDSLGEELRGRLAGNAGGAV
jgi:hypothetical protein